MKQTESDSFRHWRGCDPPEVKLAAWQLLQERLRSEARLRCATVAIVVIGLALMCTVAQPNLAAATIAAVLRWLKP